MLLGLQEDGRGFRLHRINPRGAVKNSKGVCGHDGTILGIYCYNRLGKYWAVYLIDFYYFPLIAGDCIQVLRPSFAHVPECPLALSKMRISASSKAAIASPHGLSARTSPNVRPLRSFRPLMQFRTSVNVAELDLPGKPYPYFSSPHSGWPNIPQPSVLDARARRVSHVQFALAVGQQSSAFARDCHIAMTRGVPSKPGASLGKIDNYVRNLYRAREVV